MTDPNKKLSNRIIEARNNINNFINSLKNLTPSIFSDCVLGESIILRDYHADKILKNIENNLSLLIELKAIYRWMGLPVEKLHLDKYNNLSFKRFLEIYSEEDGGRTILDKVIDDLNQIQEEYEDGRCIEGEYY